MALRSVQHLLVSFLVLLLVLCAKAGLGTTGCIERERRALLHFKHGLVDDYGLLSSWGHEQQKRDCCRWRGVRCSNRLGHIIMLHLPAPPIEFSYEYQSLRGEISPSLLELEHLTHLDLSFNDFEGSPIPPFLASLTKIQHLNLSQTNFTGRLPSQLGNLSNLLSVDLSHNYALHSGNLEWLSHLSSLRHLDLNSVDLSKAIHWSQAINKLPSLIHLNLGNCSLPPLTTSSLSHVNSSVTLAFLDLSRNYDLTSSIYPWLVNFTTILVHLDLSLNADLNGSIADAFRSMISLAYLDLRGCAFEGEILDAFGNMRSLEFLDVTRNQLQGSIPEAFGNMSYLEHLDISENQLQGSIPDAFGNMRSLEFLDVSRNQLQGSIPEAFGNMSSLEHLDISENQLQGSIPNAFGNMRSLKFLDILKNQLQGSIPDAFGNMSSLQYLDISENQLQGSIPEAFGSKTSLERLSPNENKLEGEIPKSLSNLCSLRELYLESNNLSGQLPQDLLACANHTLEILSLSHNQLRGSVPHLIGFSSLKWLDLDHNQLNGTLPTSIGQLTKLQVLDIGSNSLQGVITEAHFFHLSDLYHLDFSFNSLTFNMSLEWVPPFQLDSILLSSCKLGPHFPSWLRTQKQLKDLDISNSDISDVIPHWFWNLTSLIQTFYISNNQIIGTLPNLSLTFNYPFYIDMSSNYLEGSIPQLPSDMAVLDLSNNKFSGSISLLCSVKSYLVYLDLSNNLLSGGLPNCWPQWKSLTILNLENNRFSGKIPTSFGSLQSIQILHLRNNSLIGELPSSLKKCKHLSSIDLAKNRLSGEIPPWIGGSLPNVIVLILQANKFSGSICSKLCQLKKIHILDLSSNNLSGTIPRCLSNFTAMTKKGTLTIAYNVSLNNSLWISPNLSYVDREMVKWKGREFEYRNTLGLVNLIDLSSNKLTGEIPKEVTDLLELVSLNFSRNNLTGSIPTTIGQLKSLDVLDLSQNQLIGEIPTSLSEIDRLSTLNLSNNNLSGKIPLGTQLQSFNASVYEGNPALSGPPLLKKRPGDRAKGTPNASSYEDNIQQDGKDMWFYVSIALGFIVGFWGVCGTLLLKNSWRYSYFRFLNKIKDWLYVTTTINMARLWRSLQS